MNAIIEHVLEDTTRKTKYAGGEEILQVREFWNDYDYDGAYEFPRGCRLTDEETNYVNSIGADITTFIAENFSQFLDGSKPFGE